MQRPPTAPGTGDLRKRVAALSWYHTLELAPGIETPGWFDTRSVAGQLPWPADLAGRRCLDVGTFDGFWAFEMEARGAGSVTAVDLLDPERWDWPSGSTASAVAAVGERKAMGVGFELAADALGSSVERLEMSAYDLDPDEIGSFDLVYVGSLLLHLRDPIRALEAIRGVCSGELLLVDNVDPRLSRVWPRRPVAELDGLGRPWWWRVNRAGLVRMVESAGFELSQGPLALSMPPGAGQPRPRPTPGLLRHPEGRRALRSSWLGDPHAAILARPIAG